MLNRRDGLWRIGRGFVETEEKRVLVVADNGDDPNGPHNIWWHVDIWIFVFGLRPVAATWVDIKTELGLLCPAFQPFVDPTDLGAVGILQLEDRGILTTKIRLGNLDPAVALWPGEDGLNLEALPDALFVICRDPLCGRGFHVVDPERPLHWHLTRHRGIAGVAALDLAVMTAAAVRADEDVSGGELRPVPRSDFRRQLAFMTL